MTRIERALSEVMLALSRLGRRPALVGGLAVSARTEPRFTRDIDFAVAVSDDQDAEKLVHALVRQGYRLAALVEQDAVGRLATARLAASGEDATPLMVDLLFASSGVEHEVVSEAEVIEVFAGLHVPVAAVHHLLALKVLSRDDVRRPQDLADLRALLLVATPAEIDASRAALATITERGFSRGKDLEAELRSALALWTCTETP